jgi:AcrR family transcriptional regulator
VTSKLDGRSALRVTVASVVQRRRNRERTRRQILQAAVRLYAARGCDGVSVREIVTRARVNKRMLYHYFGSKRKLIAAALNSELSRIDAIRAKVPRDRCSRDEALSRLVEGFFELLYERPHVARMLQWASIERGSSGGVRAGDRFVRRFLRAVRSGAANGSLRRDLHVSHLLVQVVGLCSIYHASRLTFCPSLMLDPGRVKEDGLRNLSRLVFRGIARRATPE